MTVEESELLDRLIKELRSDTALLIEKFGIDTTAAPVYTTGSQRYQAVCNDFERLQHIQHTLSVNTNGARTWQNTELSNRRTGNYLSEELKSVKNKLRDNGEAKATHSYLVVTWQGSTQQIDSNGPITKVDIRRTLDGEFETDIWRFGNFEMTMCFRPAGSESGLQTNRRFKAKSGNVLIGVKDKAEIRGLTDHERIEAVNFIEAAL
jgi:hypothetical protein